MYNVSYYMDKNITASCLYSIEGIRKLTKAHLQGSHLHAGSWLAALIEDLTPDL